MGEYSIHIFFVYFWQTDPYTMLKQDPEALEGDDRFEGFAVDVIKELSNILGFNYTFLIQEDNKSGERVKGSTNGSWDGMIGRLMREEGDIAIADLTVTTERIEAIDFSPSILELGKKQCVLSFVQVSLFKLPTRGLENDLSINNFRHSNFIQETKTRASWHI